jgi:aryl-alcohol dehydrogenase-like predicted oxidoreductase
VTAQLEHRSLGRTGMSVSALGFGTVELGQDYGLRAPGGFEQPSEAIAAALLRLAANHGVDFYDTAPGYGTAERLLGKTLGKEPGCVLATKVAVSKDASGMRLHGAELRRDIERSLGRSRDALGRETLDLVHVHNATLDVLLDGEIADILLEARARGEVRAIGVTVYSEAEALAAIDAGCFDTLQVAYNLLDRRMADRVVPAATQAGVAIVVRSAFLKGALTPKARFLPPELAELERAADGVRQALGVSWEELPDTALRFCLFSPGVATVIVGLRTEEELAQALAAAEAGPLPETTLRKTAAFAITDERLVDPSRWDLP